MDKNISMDETLFILHSLHHHSFKNRKEIVNSDLCGCFYCGNTFQASEIHEWCDNGETAICPHCGIDSVLCNTPEIKISKQLLRLMNNLFFGEGIDSFFPE